MKWIKNYQLFLFDFDGLLVDTERLHFEAYKEMCLHRIRVLSWTFAEFSSIAHFSAVGLKEKLYETLPELQKWPWSELYAEKQARYQELLQTRGVPLMPGVDRLLAALSSENIPRAVVTNSVQRQTDLIVSLHPLLATIPHWITREQYQNPKPAGDCYQLAIQKFAKPGDKVIGFEDTPRGITALKTTEARPVLISAILYPHLGVEQFASFHDIR